MSAESRKPSAKAKSLAARLLAVQALYQMEQTEQSKRVRAPRRKSK